MVQSHRRVLVGNVELEVVGGAAMGASSRLILVCQCLGQYQATQDLDGVYFVRLDLRPCW